MKCTLLDSVYFDFIHFLIWICFKARGVHLLPGPCGSCRELQCLSGDGSRLCWGKCSFYRPLLNEEQQQHDCVFFFSFGFLPVGRSNWKGGEPHSSYLHSPGWHRVCWTQGVPQRKCALHQVSNVTRYRDKWIHKWFMRFFSIYCKKTLKNNIHC